MSVSDPRPASELVYASSHLPLCWISDKHPKPVFQNGSPPLSPTCFSHSHPHLLTAKSLSLFGLKTSNSSLTLLFLLYSSYDPSANVVTTYPRCLPTCYHSGLSCHSVRSPLLTGPLFQPYSLSSTAEGSDMCRIMSAFQVGATYMCLQTGPGQGGRRCEMGMWGPFSKAEKTAIKSSKILSSSFMISWLSLMFLFTNGLNINFYLLIYLTAPGLSCSMQDLFVEACGI